MLKDFSKEKEEAAFVIYFLVVVVSKQCDQRLQQKVAQIIQKLPKKVVSAVFTFKIAISITIYFGYFSKKICHQELSKIAKSGHIVSKAA